MSKQYFLGLLLLLFTLTGFSQDVNEKFFGVGMEREEFLLFSAVNATDLVKTNRKPVNDIFIEQVGERNKVNANISSQDAKVSIRQYGIEHEVGLNVVSPHLRKNIVQIGEGHTILDNVYSPFNELGLNLTQEGTNQHFERYGSNSIGNKLEFKMSGNNNAMIVRNFK